MWKEKGGREENEGWIETNKGREERKEDRGFLFLF